MSDRAEMEAAVEAVLFIAAEPVPRSRLLEIFDEEDREEAALAVDAVLERYAPAPHRGVLVEEVAGGVRLVTRPDMNGWLRRFFEVSGSNKLSMAALETLAIVAYRQPITGPEIQELRSVNPSGVLKTLLDRHLVRISGRKEVVGRPFLYCTTREFLVHFGLKSLKDLPPLEEFEETFEEASGEGEGPAEPGLGIPRGGDREETILRAAADLEEREAQGPRDEDEVEAEDEAPAAPGSERSGPRAVEAPGSGAEAGEPPAGSDEDGPGRPGSAEGRAAAATAEAGETPGRAAQERGSDE